MLKNDQTETDTREHIEVVTLESKTKDMAEILKMLEPKLEVETEDGYDIPIRYTAVASYTGTATSKYATGYTVTADYKGDVTRTSCDTVVYTAVFSSVGNTAAKTGRSSFNWLWLLIPAGAAALGGCGYAGYKGYKHYINKKRGYAA